MSWISQGGNMPVFSAEYAPLATSASAANVANTAVGNDVFGKVTLVISGTVAAGAVAIVAPPVPLPTTALVQVTPQNSQTVLGGGAAAVGWFGSINASGNIVIGTGVALSSALATATVAYFVGQ